MWNSHTQCLCRDEDQHFGGQPSRLFNKLFETADPAGACAAETNRTQFSSFQLPTHFGGGARTTKAKLTKDRPLALPAPSQAASGDVTPTVPVDR